MTNVPGPDPGDARALLVHAYSDGELDPANALAVGRQIAADPLLTVELVHPNALRRIRPGRLPAGPCLGWLDGVFPCGCRNCPVALTGVQPRPFHPRKNDMLRPAVLAWLV